MNMTTKRLSVITVSFRDPSGLNRTLESLAALLPFSDYDFNWEIIVVDGSPALNQETLNRHLKVFGPRLKSLEEEPQGIYGAMNFGISKATGEYIWFLNGGDRLKSAGILCKLLKRRGDLIIGGADLYRDGRYLYSRIPESDLLSNVRGVNHVCHQAVLYRRALFETVGVFSPRFRIIADYEHLYRCHLAGVECSISPECFVDYDMSGESTHWRETFQEYRKLSEELRARVGRGEYFHHSLVLSLESIKIRIIKAVSESTFAPIFRPGWIFMKRRAWRKR